MSAGPTAAQCPFCLLPLQFGPQEAVCPSGHAFDASGLTLASNMAAARALWMATRAMEDDAAGLSWRAVQVETTEVDAAALRAQADSSRTAAETLKALAQAAQRRLDDLPLPLSTVRLESPASD
ncbi:MAG: hypothetical protein JWM40_566 [Frankiales bacterium]|nr:hypothetical protein [Frankiales bacterium]